MKLQKLAGATSEIFQVFIRDSSSTVGAGLTGLTNASGSLTAYYHRDTDTTATVIALVSMTAGTFTSSGFIEIDSVHMPGWYQFCPPNAALAAGAKSVAFHLRGATNMADMPIEVQLTAVNPDSATAFMTSVASVVGAVGSVTGAVGSVTGAVGSVTGLTAANLDATVSSRLASASYTSPPSAATIAQAVWDVLTSALTTVNSIGKLLVTNIDAAISSRLASGSYTAPPSAATISSAVWDEPLAGHTTPGTAGADLASAASGTDPWATLLPGAYSAGMAGYIVGHNLDAAVSSRASPTNITAGTITTVSGNVNGTVGSVVAGVAANITQMGGQPIFAPIGGITFPALVASQTPPAYSPSGTGP